MKGPLANLRDNIARMTGETHGACAFTSTLFARHGDPRRWSEFDGKTPITWNSESDREATYAGFDEWVTGIWNDVPGVVRPGIRAKDSLPLVS